MNPQDPEEGIPLAPLPTEDEIQRRIQDALDRARKLSGHAPESTASSLDEPNAADRAAARLERIEAEVEDGTNSRFPTTPDFEFTRPKIPGQLDESKAENYKGAGVGLSMAYSMIGLTLAGWGIGKLFDLRNGGVLGQAIGTIVGAVMGLGGAVYSAIRLQK